MTATTLRREASVYFPPLLAWQAEVRRHSARFRVVAAGRRAGKSRMAALMVVAEAIEGRRAWWVAPSYPMASIGWREMKKAAIQVGGCQLREVDRLITFPGGGEAQVRSADNPDSLRGAGLDFLVLDECAFVKEVAWTEALRPALADRQGRALFISTPKGRNWFWHVYRRGQDGGEWQSWQFPTTVNPAIGQGELDDARRSLPERVYQQEFLAVFIEDGGGVFRRVTDAATSVARVEPEPGHAYAIGVDWAKHSDWTVLATLDVTAKRLVALDRFNQIDYAVQTTRLKALYDRFTPQTVIAESNAMGEPLIEQLVRDGLPVQPFLTTNATKTAAIDALALAFERGEIAILPDPVLIAELQAYESERLPSGLMRYGAPAGMHDDCVMALALAWQAAAMPPAASGGFDREPERQRESRRLFRR